ncbi:MAG: serine/threonine protein kinase [Myxococcales bacterium]|nr:serine/threonine protein kinase [Myxococcales bacterium]
MTVQSAQGDPPWSADELIPFGKYLLLERISSGATAAVYRAKIHGEAGFARIAAVKRLLPHMIGDPEFIDTFVREAKTVARLSHRNICPIYELGRVGESLYMAMECVSGKDLGRVMGRLGRLQTPMPPVATAWIGARLCEALDYAHNLSDNDGQPTGIVHRDLSPANVILSYEGEVKLIDFGLAKAVGRAQQTNVDALKRKLGYMSPEMVKGRPIDARSDIFGVGVLLHEMVTERRLFDGKDDIATLTMVSKASVPPPSALVEDPPEALELVIMRALERDPDDRWQTAAEMANALTEFIMAEQPLYGTRQLSAFLQGIFANEMSTEAERTRQLLEASDDPQVLASRRTFFATARGSAAAARAQVDRRGVESWPAREAHEPDSSGAAEQSQRDTAEGKGEPARRAEGIAAEHKPRSQEQEAQLPTNPGHATLPASTSNEQGPARGGTPEELEEPTDTEGPTLDEERTEFLTEHDLQVVAIEEEGFEEEPTEIFFNQDEGLDDQAGVEPTGATRPGRRRSPRPTPDPRAPMAADQLRPMLGQSAASSIEAGQAHQSGPAPMGSHPASVSVHASEAEASGYPTLGNAPRKPRQRTATLMDQRARQMRNHERLSNWMLFAGIVLLGLAVAGLIIRTPLGEQLGIRPPTRGTIEVRTQPSVSASVKLDDVYRGQAPLRLDGVQRGGHTLEIEAAGYATVRRIVPLEGGETKILDIALSEEDKNVEERP